MFFLPLYIIYKYSFSGEVCEICEETKPCNISHTLQGNVSSQLQLSWYSNGNEAMTCYFTLGFSNCNIYPQYRKLITHLTSKEPEYITTTLIFLNTSRHVKSMTIELTWRLIAYYPNLPPKLLFTCDLRIYSKW